MKRSTHVDGKCQGDELTLRCLPLELVPVFAVALVIEIGAATFVVAGVGTVVTIRALVTIGAGRFLEVLRFEFGLCLGLVLSFAL